MESVTIFDAVTEEAVSAELAHAEERIERATRNAFYEVGLELRHIRDQRFYREQYGTFEEYVETRWEWTRDRAYKLIEAAAIAEDLYKNLDILPSRESHTVPLLKLEDGAQRAEVWQRVVESGDRITAKRVEQEVERKLAELAQDWITLPDWQAMNGEARERRLDVRTSNKSFNRTNDNIEWAWWSWNPVTGCQHGCTYCYARDISNRFTGTFEPRIYPSRLLAPFNTSVPKGAADEPIMDQIGRNTVFVCSMADLFGEWVPDEWIAQVLATVESSPDWRYIFLTKNPERMIDIEWPDNVAVGTSVDCQARAMRAQLAFASIDAPVRFLSCEPMNEELSFSDLSMFEWVIMGGRSANTKESAFIPPWPWVERLLWEARRAHCAVYVKPNLIGGECRPREYPNLWTAKRNKRNE